MTYTINPQDVDAAFSSGNLTHGGKPVTFYTADIGSVVVTSGHLVVSDPFVNPYEDPLTQPIAPGKYPVSLAIARFKSKDERVAYARAKFSDAPIVRWEMALTEGQDLATLKPNHFFGFGVDSGNGAYYDPVAGELLSSRMDDEEDYFRFLVAEQEKSYGHTRSWLDVRPNAEREENVVIFSTGWGDGTYPSYFGLSVDGQPAVLISDFMLLRSMSPDESE